MPRLPRLNLQGVLYYVTSRGGDRERVLFRDREDYLTYLQLFFEYKRRYGVMLFAYCLLPDQVHLCLELGPSSNISGLMHDVTSRYTKYFNRRYDRSGHLFLERFRTVLMEEAEYVLPMTAYVHSLPARVGLEREFTGYAYSSCPAYLEPEDRQRAGEIGEEVGRVLSLVPGGYHEYLSRVEPAQMSRLEEKLEQRILGSEAFVAAVRSRIKAAQGLPTSEPAVASGRKNQTLAKGKFAWRPIGVAWASGAAAILIVAASALQNRLGILERSLAAFAQRNAPSIEASGVLASFEPESAAPVQLAGSEWDIRLMPASAGSAAAVRQDRLTFTSDKQVSALSLVDLGFSSVPIRMGPRGQDGSVTWEAMQTNHRGEVASWRGEWRENFMRGVMTRQVSGQRPETFSFVGMPKQAADGKRREI